MRECSVTRELEAHSQWHQMLVCAWKEETRVKKTRTKSGKHEKEEQEDKQGREEGLACQHTAISAFISAEHPDTQDRSPWHTAFTKAVCVLTISSQQQEPSENTMQTHTVGFFGFWLVRKSDLKTTNHKVYQKLHCHHKQASQS